MIKNINSFQDLLKLKSEFQNGVHRITFEISHFVNNKTAVNYFDTYMIGMANVYGFIHDYEQVLNELYSESIITESNLNRWFIAVSGFSQLYEIDDNNNSF